MDDWWSKGERVNELISISELWGDGYWYVGTPYTNYHLGHDTAHHYAKRIGAGLDSHGVKSFVPVIWGHEIASRTGIDSGETMFWDEFCAPFIRLARGMLIVRFTGWDTSRGISLERSHFIGVGKPVMVCDPEMILDYRIERKPKHEQWPTSMAVGDRQELDL